MGLFTCFPMIFLLFTNNIIQTKTTGKSIPLMTCDHSEIEINGALGIRMMTAHENNNNRVKDIKLWASSHFLSIPASKPNASHT